MPTLVTRGAASVRGFGFAGTTPVLTDPYFNYTTLLLHGNGTNGGQNNTFLDSGTANGGVGFDITRNGNTTQGTFSPFSQTGWSNYFDGSGDVLSIADAAALELGSSDFCVEGWYYPLSFSANLVLVGKRANTTSTGAFIIYANSGSGALTFYASTNGSTYFWSGATVGTMVLNQWNHFAVYRSGNNWYGSINGVVSSMGTSSNSIYNDAESWRIGGDSNGNYANGYISSTRIVIGSAVYGASNFTPPTAPLTNITNTSLLTCQSNRFIDNSANQFTITVNGNTSVQAFSPFAPTAAYSASTVGGSGYFDGSGDYLTVETAAESALNLTGTFTFEFWFYRNATGDIQLFSKGGGQNNWNTTNGIAYQALIETSTFKWQFSIGGGSLVSIDVTAPAISQWVHVAVGRNGTTTRVWVNGSSIGTSTSTPTPPSTRNIIYAAANQTGGNNVNGYMAGLRIVNGTDVYGVSNTSITVPTSPPTNISNTSLLLNFTNAAIIDNTAKNVLETVADAQISTAQSKFGGASLYFDGTGDFLQTPLTPNLMFGAGNFTVEFWLYWSTVTGQADVISNRSGSDQTGFLIYLGTGFMSLAMSTNGSSWAYNNGPSVTWSSGTWYHVAYTRSGNTMRYFVNGTQTYTDTFSGSIYQNQPIYVGSSGGSNSLNGYIDDLRITKGIARYTSNFTPQTSQWQDQ